PDGVSVGTTVGFNDTDMAAIAASSLVPQYQWQHGDVGDWRDITGAIEASYTAQNSDETKRLRVLLTLTDGNDTLERISQLSGVVQGNDADLESFTLFLQFDSNSQLLSLTNASAMHINQFINDNNLMNPSYQWRRVAPSGDFDRGARDVGNNPDGYIFISDDIGFSHGLRVTLETATGQTVSLQSDMTPEWKDDVSAGDDMQTALERKRYMDILALKGGSTPALDGNVLQAVLLGSIPEKDVMPPGRTYVWSRNGSGIEDAAANAYTVDMVEDAGTSLQASVSWNEGERHRTLMSDTRAVSTDNTTLPWAVTMSPQVARLPVGQLLSATHRALQDDEDVSYQWYHLSGPAAWDSKQIISGATRPDYTAKADDVGSWLGVEATIAKVGDQYIAQVESTVLVSDVAIDEALSLNAMITPIDLYKDSVLGYDVSLVRNGTLEDLAEDAVSAQWYAVNNLSAL
ncbi:hypothetical protein UB34_20680, partial [Photobacterium leiognathi]|uniref:hypothetical protein n=1 Tax=Photobacterium leiognathi TaxID=553611 RepID=UPI0005D2F092